MQVSHTIPVSGAPAIAGLAFRPFGGEADYPAMVDVVNACNQADRIEERETVEGLRHDYAHLVNCDLNTDLLVVEVDGQLIGYGRTWWWKNDDGERLYGLFGCVHPDWRRKGIGRAMLHWQEGRIRQMAAEHPQDGPRAMQSFAMRTAVGRAALLESAGYTPVRYGFMMGRSLEEPIPDLPLPPGLETRPVQPDQMRAIFDALNEAFRDHWGHRELTDDDFPGWRDWPLAMPHLWQVAWAGDQVAGMVLNTIFEEDNKTFNFKRGWTDPICVRRPWRRLGLARALIMRSLKVLKAQGMTEACLGVDTQNPSGALHLYESCGYRQINSSTTYRKAIPEP